MLQGEMDACQGAPPVHGPRACAQAAAATAEGAARAARAHASEAGRRAAGAEAARRAAAAAEAGLADARAELDARRGAEAAAAAAAAQAAELRRCARRRAPPAPAGAGEQAACIGCSRAGGLSSWSRGSCLPKAVGEQMQANPSTVHSGCVPLGCVPLALQECGSRRRHGSAASTEHSLTGQVSGEPLRCCHPAAAAGAGGPS
jgi:hypothetical protein